MGKYLYFVLFFVLWITMINRQTRKRNMIKSYIKTKNGGLKEMEEIAKKYLGTDVMVTMVSDQVIIGTLISYNDGWFIYADEKNIEKAINASYIVEIEPCDYLAKRREKLNKKAEKKVENK